MSAYGLSSPAGGFGVPSAYPPPTAGPTNPYGIPPPGPSYVPPAPSFLPAGPPLLPPTLSTVGMGGADNGVLEQSEEGFVVVKKLSLPLVLLALPLLLVAVVLVVVVVTRTTVIVLNVFFPSLFKKKKKPEEYLFPPEFYSPEYYGPPEEYYDKTEKTYRRRRQVTAGTPSLTSEQVYQLTELVFTSLASEECLQRLLCETGKVARSYGSIKTITKSVSNLIPNAHQPSFDIFAKEEKCEKFNCGDLPVRK